MAAVRLPEVLEEALPVRVAAVDGQQEGDE
jgi:hypothetical protein